MSANHIPDFPGIQRYCDGDAAASGYTAVAMYSPEYQALAERLRASLVHFGLHHAVYEVPAVHLSISPRGIHDLALTKASLIRFAWRQHRRPVLYLDCDVVLRQPPIRIAALQQAHRDFAIYNWLADECTDCFVPVTAMDVPAGRFYQFLHAIDDYAPEQLISSGSVQYWAPTPAAEALLSGWFEAQRRFPRAVDDVCLDYAFNSADSAARPSYAWLDKAYMRFAWWPHVQPVIDHPQLPSLRSSKSEPIEDSAKLPALWETRRVPRAMPRDCLIDVVGRRLYRVQAAAPDATSIQLVDVGGVDAEFYPAL
jgi:hypothetical protein